MSIKFVKVWLCQAQQVKRSERHCGAVLCSLCADAALSLVAKLETPEQSPDSKRYITNFIHFKSTKLIDPIHNLFHNFHNFFYNFFYNLFYKHLQITFIDFIDLLAQTVDIVTAGALCRRPHSLGQSAAEPCR